MCADDIPLGAQNPKPDTEQEPGDPPGHVQYVGDSLALAGSHYNSSIAQLMRTIHAAIPPSASPDFSKPAHIETRQDCFRGEEVKRAVIFPLTNGCEWALRSASGCTMCGHLAKQARTDRPVSADDFIEQFRTAMATIDFGAVPVLNVFNNGSFFNPYEIPSEARRTILRTIGETQAIQKLLVESRPEFISEDVVLETKELLRNTELEIAIGLETDDDCKRLMSINKGFTLEAFKRAATVIKGNSVRLRSYILLKPPFLSEREAIEDSTRSIATAFSLGADSVSLEAMTIQKYTLVEYLYKHDVYSVPWLWSIIEVVKSTGHLGDVFIGMFKFYPSPELVPGNCGLCNERVMNAMAAYNASLDSAVLASLDCRCKARWSESLDDPGDWLLRLRDFIKAEPGE